MTIEKFEYLYSEFQKRGFYYSKDLIFNFFMSLITKPFVILTGISGSGKSKIVEIAANIICDNENKIKNYELIPVKPNWRDSKGLFGYHNIIDGSYYITPLIKLFIRALANVNTPFFLILDEMNIAKTEHYFADYLSLIESRRMVIGDKLNQDNLEREFIYDDGSKLSEAIILSAFDINKLDTYLEIEEYRNNRFSKAWKTKFYGGQDENWLPQYRTELNQGDGRLAHRVFEGGDGKYKLKNLEDMSDEDRVVVLRLKEKYEKFINEKESIIVQNNIYLHNNNKCISNKGNECPCASCPFVNSEKYKCDKLYNKDNDEYFVPPEIPIPLNLFTIGTVNVDETTYMFSPKVLDRSNVIEFNEVDVERLYELTTSEKEHLSNSLQIINNDSYYFNDTFNIDKLKVNIPSKFSTLKFKYMDPENFALLLEIFAILKKYNLHFGYRVINEISAYMCNVFDNTNSPDKGICAFDNQILQKILPKFYGSYDKIWNPLIQMLGLLLKDKQEWLFDSDELIRQLTIITGQEQGNLNISVQNIVSVFKYPKSALKIISMLSDLNSSGFANFIK